MGQIFFFKIFVFPKKLNDILCIFPLSHLEIPFLGQIVFLRALRTLELGFLLIFEFFYKTNVKNV